jgi:TonB family protein
MRNVIVAAVAAVIPIACAVEKAAPRDRLTIEKIERVSEQTVASSTPVRAAAGNVLVIVHVVEDPAREERRDWLRSVMHDWDGREYEPRYAYVNTSESATTDVLTRRIKTVHPDRIRIVFEVPQTATVRGVTVPQPLSLFPETPVRVTNPAAGPKVVRQVEPHYPDAALRRNIHGVVKLEVLVTPEGRVAGARHIHGPQILGDAAAAAVRQWQYEPLVVDGKAVPALIEVPVDFRQTPLP